MERRLNQLGQEPTPSAFVFMEGLSYTTIIEPAEPLARRRSFGPLERRLPLKMLVVEKAK